MAFAFANVNALPYSAVTGTTLSLPVTIENHRGASVNYTVTATGSESATAHGHGSVMVPDGALRQLNLRVVLTCVVAKGSNESQTLPTARVVITLQPSGESLTHTMYCRAPV